MAVVKELPATLMQAKSFSRKEYINAMMACYNMTEAQIVYDLQKRVKEGTLGTVCSSGEEDFVYQPVFESSTSSCIDYYSSI